MLKRLSLAVQGRTLKVGNLEKVFYPATGMTKGQVIDYYRAVAPAIIPHLADHPLTLKRYPDGVEGEFFYEKRCPSYRPDWMLTADDPQASRPLAYCVVNDEPSLVWVANLASIELHTLLSTSADPDRPTAMVFDLDPGEPANLLDCVRAALLMRDMLEGLHLESFPKSSGGKGLHFYVPLNTPVTFEQTKRFSQAVALTLERDAPERFTSNMSKALRVGKVFVDWSQNDRHKTTICAYSLRARERPTVSTPLSWEELRRALRRGSTEGLVLEAHQLPGRLQAVGDLFEPVLSMRQELPM